MLEWIDDFSFGNTEDLDLMLNKFGLFVPGTGINFELTIFECSQNNEIIQSEDELEESLEEEDLNKQSLNNVPEVADAEAILEGGVLV